MYQLTLENPLYNGSKDKISCSMLSHFTQLMVFVVTAAVWLFSLHNCLAIICNYFTVGYFDLKLHGCTYQEDKVFTVI